RLHHAHEDPWAEPQSPRQHERLPHPLPPCAGIDERGERVERKERRESEQQVQHGDILFRVFGAPGAHRLRGWAPYTAAPINSTANPRNAKKPTTSVTVVKMIAEHCAGSSPTLLSSSGMDAPAMPAQIMFTIIPSAITTPSMALPYHAHATAAVNSPVTTPVMAPSSAS